MWFKYGLKAQKPQKQHALKGQKLLAQGIALGIIAISKAPCKGKSLVNTRFFKAFALTGRQGCVHNNCFYPTRPERAEAPSPGHRPGLLRAQTCRPVRAKALKYRAIYKAFALTGRLANCYYTQGDALG